MLDRHFIHRPAWKERLKELPAHLAMQAAHAIHCSTAADRQVRNVERLRCVVGVLTAQSKQIVAGYPELRLRIAREVLLDEGRSEAIKAGGSSLRDHKRTDGELGYFQHHFAVYDRKNKLCHRKDGGVINRIVQTGRSSFYCPVCQR